MRRFPPLAALAVVTALSCTKNEPAPTPPTTEDGAQADASDDPIAHIDTSDFPEKLAEQLAARKAKAQEVRARWTPELRESVANLTSQAYDSPEAAIDAVLASPHRTPGYADRDQYRHPKETLLFFGLRPDMKVFEYAQGAGWYTEVLAPLLARDGTLYLTGYDASSADPKVRYGAAMTELFLTEKGNLYENIQTVTQTALEAPPNLGEPGSLDMVLVIRMFHNVHRSGAWDQLMPAIHSALKSGGVLGVVQHRAADDASPDASAPQGYLPEPWLVEKISGYGFELAERSEINANPKDTKDYEKGVWTLPPSLANGDQDRAKYEAIGESDRATLKFVKVER